MKKRREICIDCGNIEQLEWWAHAKKFVKIVGGVAYIINNDTMECVAQVYWIEGMFAWLVAILNKRFSKNVVKVTFEQRA